jgi:NAD(P)-dependent dehydrogenase (short-subunit alcohol dehydrogenase family)
LLDVDERSLREALEVNFLGAWRTSRAFVPGMRARAWGRVVNVSTEAGPGVKVNWMSPGWVATRMGGRGAPTSVEDGADTAVWLATLPDDGPTDGFFYQRRRIPWSKRPGENAALNRTVPRTRIG